MLPAQAARYLLARLEVEWTTVLAPARTNDGKNYLNRQEVVAQVSLELQEVLGNSTPGPSVVNNTGLRGISVLNTPQGIECKHVMPADSKHLSMSFRFPHQLDPEDNTFLLGTKVLVLCPQTDVFKVFQNFEFQGGHQWTCQDATGSLDIKKGKANCTVFVLRGGTDEAAVRPYDFDEPQAQRFVFSGRGITVWSLTASWSRAVPAPWSSVSA
jgi:hypothetical protein